MENIKKIHSKFFPILDMKQIWGGGDTHLQCIMQENPTAEIFQCNKLPFFGDLQINPTNGILKDSLLNNKDWW
eukprot:12736908-Ditylum_brightwellii.AAC.1